MTSIEMSGKTVEIAIADALAQLRATKEAVDITIIDTGSKGLLGFGAKPAKVLVTIRFNPEEIAKEFLREVSAAMGISVQVETEMKDRGLSIQLKGDDANVFIGKRGQTLDSIQYLTSLVVNKGEAPYVNVMIDTGNYRQKRKETLEYLAYSLAKKAKQTKRKVFLEPMSSYERRIIHAALQNDKYVSTHSEGDEPYRNVVISPKS